MDSPHFGPVRTYMGPDKAYIQHKVGDRWPSVVNFTNCACGGKHKEMLRYVWNHLSQEGFDKAAVDDLKEKLMSCRIVV